MIVEVHTYADLLRYLQALDAEQLSRPVQILMPQADRDRSVPLGSVLAIGTIEDMEEPLTRSSYDNVHHPRDIVLLCDANLFDEDGSIGFNLMTGERIWPGGKRCP